MTAKEIKEINREISRLRAKIAVDTGGINTPDNIRKMCNRYHW